MSVRRMISKNQPARLLVTIFGKRRESEETGTRETQREQGVDILPTKRDREEEQESSPEIKKARMNEITENLEREKDEIITTEKVPEKVAEETRFHGPKFRALRHEDQQWLRKIHVNLGHPNKEKLKIIDSKVFIPNH